ncbi:DUF3795 domain-containing protein [Miniphocaeibacter massiliensis]|uniref:DUF3795 domain-containing protein n=1 Tax=Miniphocaeibacter massiliensis TaxID=2041841 RepID=UPI000C08945F|nr:DUF3795 domain-containing protein [Miniphocaeibacter massiliensis]
MWSNCIICSAYLNKKKPCPGCRAPKEEHTRKSCANCLKKKCAVEKGLNYCFECDKFPCSKIKSLNKRYLEDYNIDIIENSKKAKENTKKFLEEQVEIYTCKECGGVIDVHHKKCSDCGVEF